MRRVLVTLVFAAVLAAAALPYYFGRQAEDSYRAWVQRIAQQTTTIRPVTAEYRRGWLESTAETVVEEPPGVPRWRLSHRVVHGPFPYRALGWRDLQPAQAVIDTQLESLEGQPTEIPAALRTLVSLDGSAATRVSGPSFAGPVPEAEGTRVRWEGVQGDVWFPADVSRIQAQLKAPALRVNEPEGDWTAQGMGLHVDLYQGAAGLTLGRVELGVGEIGFRAPGDDVDLVRVRNWRVRSDSRAYGEFVRASVELDVDSMAAAGTEVGPGRLAVEATRLDLQTLGDLRRALQDAAAQQDPGGSALLSLLQLGPQLLSHGPHLRVDAGLTTPNGPLRGDVLLVVTPGAPEASILSSAWVDRLQGDASLFVPSALVATLTQALASGQPSETSGEAGSEAEGDDAEGDDKAQRVQQRLQEWLDSGYLLQEGDAYVARLHLEDRRLTLNGRPLVEPQAETPAAPESEGP